MNEDLRPITKKRKGLGVGDIAPLAMAIGTAVIVVALVALILAQMNSNVSDANATYVLTKGLTAMTSFADWFAVIVIVGVAIIILGLVMLLRTRDSGGY